MAKNLQNSLAALKILQDIDQRLHISLMRQYFPLRQAQLYPEINRQTTEQEFEQMFGCLWELGLENGWAQEKDCGQVLIPDFTKKNPFG